MRRLVGLSCVFAAACGPAPAQLEIATTTSLVNSQLLQTLLPQFTAFPVRVHAAGSGRSLAMLAAGTVDLVISHAPEAEQQYLAQHPDWRYQKLAYNHLIIVGPREDPASVRSATVAVDAFRRIATSQTSFISRGDESGTHERERLLWKHAAASPTRERLPVSGASMAVTLRQADNQLAYTLTDDATWRQLKGDLDGLAVAFEGDPLLLNTYAVLHPAGNARATRFAEWLTKGDGRSAIAAYQIDNNQVFTVWPADCAGAVPDAQLCSK